MDTSEIRVVPRQGNRWVEWPVDPADDVECFKAFRDVGRLSLERLHVCISNLAYNRMAVHAKGNPDREVLGVLVGTPVCYRDRRLVFIHGTVRADRARGDRVSVTLDPEAWGRLNDERERLYPRATTVGWYHTHPGMGVFLSSDDRKLHGGLFKDPYHVALVMDPSRAPEQVGVFVWHEGSLVPPAGQGFSIFVPTSRFEEAVTRVRDVAGEPKDLWQRHPVRKGEVL